MFKSLGACTGTLSTSVVIHSCKILHWPAGPLFIHSFIYLKGKLTQTMTFGCENELCSTMLWVHLPPSKVLCIRWNLPSTHKRIMWGLAWMVMCFEFISEHWECNSRIDHVECVPLHSSKGGFDLMFYHYVWLWWACSLVKMSHEGRVIQWFATMYYTLYNFKWYAPQYWLLVVIPHLNFCSLKKPL